MLALDGGGIRGVITLRVLQALEEQLRQRYGGGEDFRLCRFFDYIAGTSTGAIIAAALARGKSVAEVDRFYQQFGREVFAKRPWYELWRSLYGSGRLQAQLQEVYGTDTNLLPEHLESLLLVVTRNATTDSVWPVSSNPSALFNDPASSQSNLHFSLWQLVRASTAAPVFFPPEVIQYDRTDPTKSFVFVDGGTTAYNSPGFLQFRMATEPAYRLGWARGEDRLLLVSVGTGSAPVLGATALEPERNVVAEALTTLKALMSQAQFDQDHACRTVGRCTHGPFLDLEIGDLVPRQDPADPKSPPIPLETPLGRAFLYARYDAILTGEGLGALGLGHVDPEVVGALDSVAAMDDLRTVGEAVGRQVSLDHLGAFADPETAPLAPLRGVGA